MEKITISEQGLSKMCRLCLSKNDTLIEMFTFSPDLNGSIANAVCKCASIHIKRNDELPNYICRLCYVQLIKTHQFQSKAVQSDKTLRCYLQQLQTVGKQSERKNSVMCFKNCVDRDSSVRRNKVDIINCSTKTNGNSSTRLLPYNKEDDILKDDSCTNSELKTSNPMHTIKESDETRVGLTHKTEETDFTDNCEESKADLDDIKTILIDSESDVTKNLPCYDLKSSADFFVKCELQFNENLDKNIKLENEVPNGLLISNLNDDNSDDTSGDQKMRSVKKEQLLERKAVDRRSYQCDVCKKCFIWLSYLKRHKRTHTDEKPYQCDVCKKCFNQLRNLNTHKLTHTGEKPYQCEICSECFIQLGNLNRHKLTHTGEKPYRCDICFKSYTQSSHLNTHKLTHTGEKPYQCDVCNKCFTRSSHLNTHKFTHTGEKPYQCNVCNKCFTRLKTLKTHKFTHTGEKSYQCDVCSKCFTYSSTLNSHKSIHTGEKPFQCDICKKCFNHSSNLRKHKLTHTVDG